MREVVGSSRHFRIADQIGHLLEKVLPKIACSAAIVSCRFTIQGPESVGQKSRNWGRWIRTRLNTFGHRPSIDIWQGKHVLSGDGHSNANVILNCFGLSINQVLDHYGIPKHGEMYHLTLIEVIETLAKDLVLDAAA